MNPQHSNTHTVSVFAAVDQGLSDRIAKAIGHPSVQPLKVKSANEARRFRADVGKVRVSSLIPFPNRRVFVLRGLTDGVVSRIKSEIVNE